MTNRRDFLAGFKGGASLDAINDQVCAAPVSDAKGSVPDVLVETHEGKIVRLYTDLIQNRVVTVNFTSLAQEASVPISSRLAETAALLGDRLGREVWMISISSDPHNDTAERLAAFHKKVGGYRGWTFVRASEPSAAAVAHRFYRCGRDVVLGGKIDIVQYGNAKVGLWGAFPWDIKPHDAANRITWVMPRVVPAGELRRAGPRRLAAAGDPSNNRNA